MTTMNVPTTGRRTFCGLLFAVALAFCQAGFAVEPTTTAQTMIATVDALDVEANWPAGVHVHWESGVPDGRPESGTGKHTHCSAFVAAAAKRLGVYILRPPEHGQVLLANAQYDWLASPAGREHGWEPVDDALTAQSLANRGQLVVASYRNHHEDKPGHIAIVRPARRSADEILRDGPEITQAGLVNYHAVSLRQGFAGHPAAWGKGEVRFFAHRLEPAQGETTPAQ